MRETKLGTLSGIGMALAGMLLSGLLAGNAWALTATDCSTCHGADIVEGHHDPDVNSLFSQGLCTECHVGITTSGDCTTCHTATGLNNKHHIPPTGQTSIDCAQCHTGAGDPQNCSGCHQGEVPRNFHHTQLTAPIYYVNGKLNCAGCHPDATLTSNCQACHNATTGADPRTQHHSYTDEVGNKPACTSCHTQLASTGSCQDCHAPNTPQTLATHHNFTGTISCSSCHPAFPAGTVGTGCGQCHGTGNNDNNRAFHHDTVMPGLASPTCASCHAGAVAVSGCATCHTGSMQTQHHTPTTLAGSNCNSCHTSASYSQSGCAGCHDLMKNRTVTPKYPNKHHDIANISLYGCGSCHYYGTSVPVTAAECFDCHEFVRPQIDLVDSHHSTPPYNSNACSTCHSGIVASNLDCSGCHSATSPKPATPVAHHLAASAKNIACLTCHQKQGITAAGSDACSDCHEATGATTAEGHHQKTDPLNQNKPYDCLTCHDGAQSVYQSCQGCHEKVRVNNVVTTIEMSALHHMTTVYTTGPCSTCHKTVDGSSLQKDCSSCHVGTGKPSIVTQHHSTDAYLTGNCTGCHANTVPADIPCAMCHPKGTTITNDRHHNKTVVVNNTVQPKPCKDCHSTIQLVGGSCEGCHTAPIPQIHHGDPLTAVANNCAVCHQSVSDPSVCGNCHTSSPHHVTTWSQTGDCAHCHAVPASASDRPAQAACRECHGTTTHDKGGPIQNYGICAACHNTIPFHPAPTSIPGYTGYGAGKKKFNMFWSRYAQKEGPGEKIYPNGEDMNDEGGDKIKAQQLSFSTKQISSNGRTYTVPFFTGMPTSNLALSKTASASRAESGYGAALAVDGNATTRWWAKSTSTQWLKVDLGSIKTISKIALRWHSYYATEYEVRVSTDNSTWTRVADANYGKGGLETWSFTGRNVRYIQIYCQRASSYNGFAIYELEAYAP